jgi:hypothetical protein
MTDMELRIRIAELVGWRECKPKGSGFEGSGTFEDDASGLRPEDGLHRKLPHYDSDLNATHELENLMTEEQKYRYDTVLENRTKYHTEPPRWRWNATARQRAEAYVKVMEQYT